MFQAVAFGTIELDWNIQSCSFHVLVRHIYMNSLVWEIAWVGLEKPLTSYCVCACMWADIISSGVNDISFSHSTDSWVESLLRNHRFKQNDLLFYEYWQTYTSAFLRQHKQSLIETVYIVPSYSWNTKINSTFIRWTLLLHVFYSYQVTFIKTGTPPDAGFSVQFVF